MIPLHEHITRRQALLSSAPKDSLVLIPAAKEILRNGQDNHFEFRQNSDFWYLTGFREPEAVLVLAPGRAEGETILFNRIRNPAEEVWTGKRAGQEGARQHYGMDQAFPIETFEQRLPELMSGRSAIYYPIARSMEFDRKILKALDHVRSKLRRGAVAPDHIVNSETLLHEMRVIKSDAELALMKNLNRISGEAHIQMMQQSKPGMFEYEYEAIIRHHCYQHGCRALAYSPIVGSGHNACVLHYVENNRQTQAGDLVLIDAGGEYEGYASDITRTFPVNGRFTPEQKVIYNIVLKAQETCLAIIKPGFVWSDIQTATVQVITEGLLDAGILNGNVNTLIEQKAYLPFYMHLAGHFLGLDTHDAGIYFPKGKPRTLEKGMVFTIEPGIYIAPDNQDVDARWRGIGVRIEDNVIVTATGLENMTAFVPKSVNDIETLMS